MQGFKCVWFALDCKVGWNHRPTIKGRLIGGFIPVNHKLAAQKVPGKLLEKYEKINIIIKSRMADEV